MPIYSYVCQVGHTFEGWNKVDERYDVACPHCPCTVRIQIVGSPGARIFQPGWWDNIDQDPVYISSPQQLRDECDKRDLYSVDLAGSAWRTRRTVENTEREVYNAREQAQYDEG